MQSIHDIKQRMKAITDTKQITKAMYLISSAKMNKARSLYRSNLEYFEKIRSTMKDILSHTKEPQSHEFFKQREGSRAAYLIMSGDKGLCGAYNRNIIELAEKHMEENKNEQEEQFVFMVGNVGRDYFLKKGKLIDIEFLYAAQNPTLYNAREIAEDIINLYKENMMDEVYLVYTQMGGKESQTPKLIRLLPIERSNLDDIQLDYQYDAEIIYHPSPKSVFDWLVPKYVIGLVYGALVQAFASENEARMISMDTATSNADDMISDLTQTYNQARQSSITAEISEIISGADAVKSK